MFRRCVAIVVVVDVVRTELCSCFFILWNDLKKSNTGFCRTKEGEKGRVGGVSSLRMSRVLGTREGRDVDGVKTRFCGWKRREVFLGALLHNETVLNTAVQLTSPPCLR